MFLRLNYKSISDVLEVGCSIGNIPKATNAIFNKRNIEYLGIDLDESAIKIARGIFKSNIKFANIPISDLIKKRKKFDVVMLFEVLEHLYDPKYFLINIYKLLKRRGFIYLTTPNFLAYDFLELEVKYNNFYGPSHLNYFNPESISILVKDVGFKEIRVYSDGILDVDIVNNYYKSKKIKLYGFWNYIFKNHNKYRNFLSDFQSLLRKYLLSGNITIVATK